ncbi:hypothetical protein HPB47_023704 [Ixodes persulcatus]|uniref:Uncharacterized protein n=1 Tax=Ixodes persulcatus TaxID=34615 RepID=A0AC60Q6B4_IXOPE|nr:hypothetical protein HPB47_023704 [Ixodes persulcatus]
MMPITRAMTNVAVVTANGFFPNGMYEGGFANLGSRDQCLHTDSAMGIKGRYCTLFWRPNTDYLLKVFPVTDQHDPRQDIRRWLNNTRERFHVGMRSGICVPSPCQEQDMDRLASSFASIYGASAFVRYCEVAEDSSKLKPLERGIIGLRPRDTKRRVPVWKRALVSYSAVTNTKKLLDLSTPSSDSKRLRFLHGVKCLSVLWVVMAHAYYCIQPDAIGPVAQQLLSKYYDGCSKNWWTVLLHINNFNRYEDIPIQGFLWTVSLACMTFMVFCSWPWNNMKLPSRTGSALYSPLHKDAWALSLFWITFACATGRGGIVNGFLSWRAFVVPSRLTYSVYLIHYLVYLARSGVSTVPLQLHEFLQFKDFLGVAVLSYLLGYLLYLIAEAPTANIEKILLGGRKEGVEAKASAIRAPDAENGKIRADCVPNLESQSKL